MKRVADEPVSPGDDLDGLLRAYFQSEMPSPWPRFQAPAKSRLLPFRDKAPSALPRWTSRAALVAAGVLLLLALGLMPRVGPATGEAPPKLPSLGPGTAGPKGGLPRGGSDRPGTLTPDKAKGSSHLDQGDDRTGFKLPDDLPPER